MGKNENVDYYRIDSLLTEKERDFRERIFSR